MATGMEFMLKSMGLDPEAITEYITGIGETIVAFKKQLNRVEAKTDLILEHLGIEYVETEKMETNENEHGKQLPNGQFRAEHGE